MPRKTQGRTVRQRSQLALHRQGEAAAYHRYLDTLPNGLRTVTVELPHLHTAAIVLYVKSGSRYESARTNGLSHFLEHMLFRGTERYPDSFALNYAIESLGATLYAETGRDYTLYEITLHPSSVQKGLALFGEILGSPTFPDLRVEKRIVLEEILEDLDEQGNDVNIDNIARASLWPDHPLGYKITGSYDSVKKFRRSDLQRHHQDFYGAKNLVLCVSGNVDHATVMQATRKFFGRLPAGTPAKVTPPVERQDRPAWLNVFNQGSQTSLQILFRGLPEIHPDYPALQALLRVLDDGISTRLHHRIVDELGLAYYVSASVEAYVDTGVFEIDATVAHKNAPALVREVLAILTDLRDRRVRPDELEKAKNRYRWELEASLDDVHAVAGWFGGAELFYPPDDFETKRAKMEAVTAQDIRRVAQRVIAPRNLNVTAVGMLDGHLEAEVAQLVYDFQ
jgi:predicted Zn-dependent peptidase